MALTEPLPPSKFTVLPLIQIFREKDRTIRIGLEMISQVEKMGTLAAT